MPQIGQVISHYRIIDKIGGGGMGTVYKAEDTQLGRLVAIKVISPKRGADPEAKRRFIQEAHAASALNHPNIVTIHEIVSEDGADFIVMEYVRGRTLEQLIGKRGLHWPAALKYAVQMADALAAAHQIGIIHRDFKPANVMVVEGQDLVKILDFGLAKLGGTNDSRDPASIQTTQSRTEPKTADGQILGTHAYMSPEQAEGKHVDARSDIFSFGAVLYEMLSGRQAFQGDSKVSILAAVLREDPGPLSATVHDLPRELVGVVELCLRKDRSQRLQHMGDIKLLLEHWKQQPVTGKKDERRPGLTARHVLVIVVFVVLAALLTAGILTLTRSEQSSVSPTLTRLTWDSGLTEYPVLSPDGRYLAYASDRSGEGNLDIWVQQLSGGDSVRLTKYPSDDSAPSFSPDGSRIAFRSDRDNGGIYVISPMGGQERLIARSGRDPRFSPDGTRIVYWVGEPANFYSSGKVFVVSFTTGKPTEIITGFADARYPIWTPDGKHILFQGLDLPNGKPDWWVAPAGENGPSQEKPVKTGAFDDFQREGLSVHMGPGGFRDNWVFFSANAGNTRSIYKVQISTRDWKVDQAPQRLTFGTALEIQPFPGPDSQLTFVSLNFSVGVWSVPIRGLGQPGMEIQRLTEGRAFDGTPSASRDGRRVVFTRVGSRGSRDLWLKDFQTDSETALTATTADEISPVISSDGLKVAYSLSAFPEQIYVMDLSASPGSSVAEKVCDNCGSPVGWTPDGSEIIYVYGRPKSIGALKFPSSTKTQLLRQAQYDLDQAQFSPDGTWISVVEYTGPDQTVIYAVPFRDGAAAPENQWIRITGGGAWDDLPRWSTDGNLIYFYSKRDGYGCLWQQLLDRSTRRPIGPPSAVHHFHSSRLSLMHMALNRIGISVTPDRLIFNLIENSGNIWMLQGEPKL